MIEFYLAWSCFILFIILLIALAFIDNKFYILPNRLVLPLAILGILFHFFTNWELLSLKETIYGMLAGFGLLFVIRIAGNYFLKLEDSVGLGDVKLMGAVGLWLGLPNVMLVFILGGVIGVLHGTILKYNLSQKAKLDKKVKVPKLSHINIPAGVGLCIATLVVFFYTYGDWWNKV